MCHFRINGWAVLAECPYEKELSTEHGVFSAPPEFHSPIFTHEQSTYSATCATPILCVAHVFHARCPVVENSSCGLCFCAPNPCGVHVPQATAQLYEQGGLNHDMSFFLTAVAFYSLERPDVKVRKPLQPAAAIAIVFATYG